MLVNQFFRTYHANASQALPKAFTGFTTRRWQGKKIGIVSGDVSRAGLNRKFDQLRIRGIARE